ncbi:hypothetical protein BH20CHL6_BH20CHL6_16040 [soil metagenome]
MGLSRDHPLPLVNVAAVAAQHLPEDPPVDQATSTNTRPSLRTQVRGRLERALEQARTTGSLPGPEGDVSTGEPEVTRPGRPEHGDFASNLALKLARPLHRPPLVIAEALGTALRELDQSLEAPLFAEITVAPPGFLNLRLTAGALESGIDDVSASGPRFGRLEAADPRRINVEFGSANPTGPLTIGNARGAFVGDLLCRVLETGGHHATREY